MDKTKYAFPQEQQVGAVSVSEGGLTLLDYFAAKAMAAQMANPFITERFGINHDVIVKESYMLANAMMEARKK